MSKRTPILIGFILLILISWISITSYPPIEHLHKRLDFLTYDVQLYTKLLTHPIKNESPIAIVDIDQKSLTEQGRWPWARSKLAKLVNNLQAAGVAVIAMDMTFPEPEINEALDIQKTLVTQKINNPQLSKALETIAPYFGNDVLFAESLKKSKSILGFIFQGDKEYNSLNKPIMTLQSPVDKDLTFFVAKGFIGNIPLLQQAATSLGFINVFADEDGVIRRVPLLIRDGDGLYPSLALEAARTYLFGPSIKLISAQYGNSMRLEGLELAGHAIPTDAKAQILVPFIGGRGSFPYFSATDVINNKIPAKALQDKIVFLGVSAVGLGDLQPTPVQSGYPGVEIHASIAYGILQDAFYYKPPWALGAELVITIFLGLLLIFIFPYLGAALLIILTVAIPGLLILINGWFWNNMGLVLSMLMPILFTILLAIANLAYGFLFESRRRVQVQEMFGQYVPAKHIDQMLKTSSNFGLSGEDREMTVLFADIRNFTSISEPLQASDLKELLNQYLTPMTQIIFDNQGTVDKYVGDLIMAFWGAPLADKQHAKHALESALAMQKSLTKLAPEFYKQNWPEINIGIGLNTGVMTVGDMGSKFRKNYTVLGDSVNLASRLENLTKFYGVKIIASQSTCQGQNEFIFRLLDKVKVKGKTQGVEIYEVICQRAELADELQQELQISARALTYYFEQRWEESLDLFNKLTKEHPETKLYQIYISRIISYQENPPPKDWDGIFQHIEK